MRTEQEILHEYDQAYEKYRSVEKTETYISRINYLIKNPIRDLRPRYSNGGYNHAEIYPRDDEEKPVEERYRVLYDLWHHAPYEYDIPANDRIRINGILDQNFTLENFKEVIDATKTAKKEFSETRKRLLDEYALIDKDMKKLIDNYIDALTSFDGRDYRMSDLIHPLLQFFIENRCEIILRQT